MRLPVCHQDRGSCCLVSYAPGKAVVQRDKKWEQHGLCLMKTIQGDSSFLSTKAPVMSWLYLAVCVLGISRFFQEGSSGKNCKGNRYFSSLDSGDFRVLVLRLMFDSICMTGTNE